jgi:hypothetical protein
MRSEIIAKVKALRQNMDAVNGGITELRSLVNKDPGGIDDVSELHRSIALAKTNLDQATMWLGMSLKAIGTPNPYPESKNPDSLIIEKSDLTFGKPADISNDERCQFCKAPL